MVVMREVRTLLARLASGDQIGNEGLKTPMPQGSTPPPRPLPGIPTQTVLGARQHDRIATQEFHLVLVNTDGAGNSFPLVSAQTKIGKATENDVVLDHPTVSRNHLLLRRQGERFLVQDLGSTNGTFVDGAQVRE